MADLIDKQAAIDAVHKSILDFFDICYDDEESPMTYKDERLLEINKAITTQIKAVPSAQPEKMRGRWQEITESDCSGYDPVLAGYDDPVVGYVCSACHEGYEKEVMGDVAWNYCPNCGADMRGE